MDYYRIVLECPACRKQMHATTVAVGPDWGIVLNLICPECKQEGGVRLDMCDLVARAREEAGTVLQ